MIFSNGAVKLPLVSLNLLFYKKMETHVWEVQCDHCIFSNIVVLTLEHFLCYSF